MGYRFIVSSPAFLCFYLFLSKPCLLCSAL